MGHILIRKGMGALRQLGFCGMCLLIHIQMSLIYAGYLTNIWGYQGFLLNINGYKLVVSCLIMIIFVALLNQSKHDRMSHFFVIVLFFTMYTPINIIYTLMDSSTVYFVMVSVVFFIITMFTVFINDRYRWQAPAQEVTITPLHMILGLMSIITFVGMTIQNIGNVDVNSILNLTEVYGIRRATQYRWGMNYLFSWQTKVINPYMIAVYHTNKNTTKKMIYILFQLFLFVLTGHKIVLFTLIMIFLIFRYKKSLTRITVFFVFGLALAQVISQVELLLFQRSVIIDFVIRRVFFIPAMLSFHYYDFFSMSGFLWWRHSLFGRIAGATTGLDVEPSFIIGRVYFNNNANAVTGFLGSEYMNGGFMGLLLAAGAIVILLKLSDRFAYKLGVKLTLLTLLTPMYTIWNTNFLTALLTGGILLAIVILFFTETNNTVRPHEVNVVSCSD